MGEHCYSRRDFSMGARTMARRFGISLAALAAALASPAQAAEADGTVAEVVVTASRTGATIEELPVSVSIATEEEIGKQLDVSANIMRALELTVPGLAPQQGGRVNCPKIRGRLTALQINGVPVAEDIRQSTCDQVYQLSPFAIERVEVLRGGTALYGAGAPGGIINFITRRAAGEALEIDALAQTSFNTSGPDDTFTTNLYAGAGQTFANWDYYVGAAYTDGGGARTPDGPYVPAREFDAVNLNASVAFRLVGGELRATGTFYEEEKGRTYAADGNQAVGRRVAIVIPVDPHPQGNQNVLRSYALAVGFTHPDVLGHELAVSAFLQDQLYRQRDNFFFDGFGNDFFASDSDNERQGFRSTLVKRMDAGGAAVVLSYGFDWTRNRYYRPQIDPSQGGRITGFIAPETILRTTALFAQGEIDFGRWRLVGGARQEWYQGKVGRDGFDLAIPRVATPGDFRDENLALFNVGAVYELTETVQLYGGFSQGAELSQLGRAARGIRNPGLISPEPATSDQYEIGLRGQLDRLRFEAAAFYSESERASLLQADPTCAGQTLCPLVPLRAPQRFKGFEGAVDYALTPAVDLRGVVTWQRGEIRETPGGEYIDYSADTVAPLRVTGAVEARPMGGLSLTLQASYYGEADYFSTSELGLGRIATDDVLLFDASIRYDLGPGQVYLGAANLFDKEYVNVASQAMGNFAYHRAEGRRVTVGYRARF